VRLLAAVAVLVAHCPPAYGSGVDIRLGGVFLGTLAVHVFFAISGYLIAQSWFTDPHAGRFLARRALRVLPALAVVVLAAVFAIGPVFTTLDLCTYFENVQTWRYFGNLALILQNELPGVFQSQPDPQLGVNPPLWSLHYEAGCYVGLAVAATLCKPFPRLAAPLLMAGVVMLTSGAMMLPQQADLACLCFALGVALYRYRDSIPWRPDVGFVVCAAQPVAMLAALGYTAVAVGRSAARPAHIVTRHGDLSYGTYIWAYPAQRVVNELLGLGSHWAVSLALCLVATLALAWLSWRLVERPALSFKPRAMRQGPANETTAVSKPA
jgi:peptidoglycan/LPS O-acetylase OafA/YrhL